MSKKEDLKYQIKMLIESASIMEGIVVRNGKKEIHIHSYGLTINKQTFIKCSGEYVDINTFKIKELQIIKNVLNGEFNE